jgi:hypothetical protein
LETVLLTRFMLKHKAQFPEKLKPWLKNWKTK